jgi:hypothetical protein
VEVSLLTLKLMAQTSRPEMQHSRRISRFSGQSEGKKTTLASIGSAPGSIEWTGRTTASERSCTWPQNARGQPEVADRW